MIYRCSIIFSVNKSSKISTDSYCMEWKEMSGSVSLMFIFVTFALLFIVAHIWGQIDAVLNIWKFSKWPPFWTRDKLFYRQIIPEVEYTKKIAIGISDILSFWSTLVQFFPLKIERINRPTRHVFLQHAVTCDRHRRLVNTVNRQLLIYAAIKYATFYWNNFFWLLLT